MPNLSDQQIEIITSKVIKIHEEQKEASEKIEKDKRLRNTKLLLQHYRSFKKYAENLESDTDADCEEIDVGELLVSGEDLVKSIRQTSQRTLIMVRHIDHALAALKHFYSLEKHPGTRRQFDILCERYVERLKIDEIAEKNEIETRSVYRAIDAATERLAIILFGVYGIRLE